MDGKMYTRSDIFEADGMIIGGYPESNLLSFNVALLRVGSKVMN